MVVIGRRELCVGDTVPTEVEVYVDRLQNRGHFGSTDTGACIAVFGKVQVPEEIMSQLALATS